MSARRVLQLLVDLRQRVYARVIVHAQGVVVQPDEVGEGDGGIVLLAQLAYLADELVYLVGLGIALMHRFLVQRVADDLLKEVAELTQLVAVVLLGDADDVVGGNADLVDRHALKLQYLGHAAVVAVVLLDGNTVGHRHDAVNAPEIVADHGRGQGVHKAQRIVQRGLGSLRVAALHYEVGFRAGSGYPLLRHEVTVVLDELLPFAFPLNQLDWTVAGHFLQLLHDLFHQVDLLSNYSVYFRRVRTSSSTLVKGITHSK